MIFIKSQIITIENVQKNIFVVNILFEKKTINIQQKYTILNIKRSVYKNYI